MIFIDHIENAVRSLRRNRMRTFLTTLGIAIGVASVTTILALSGGMVNVIGAQVEEFDGNLGIIRPGLQTKDPNSIASPVTQYTFSTSTLTQADLESLEQLDAVGTVAPIMTIDGMLKTDTTSVQNNVVLATTPSFPRVSGIEVRDGQFIDEITDRSTAVIGPQLAIDLFGTDRPLGQRFSLRGQDFTVIGVLKRTSKPVNFNNIDFDQAVIVSLEAGKGFHEGRTQIQQINFAAKTTEQLPQAAEQIRAQLVRNHLGETDFTVVTGKDIGKPTSQLFEMLRNVMTAIAAISLLVGGIGIMNIMLVGVAERTREIGIRKAVGASSWMIVGQFLIESLMMSLLGGVIGYILGYVVAFTITAFFYFIPEVTWSVAAVALGMAIGVGVIFGLYPALRAARKDTIESLRQYH